MKGIQYQPNLSPCGLINIAAKFVCPLSFSETQRSSCKQNLQKYGWKACKVLAGRLLTFFFFYWGPAASPGRLQLTVGCFVLERDQYNILACLIYAVEVLVSACFCVQDSGGSHTCRAPSMQLFSCSEGETAQLTLNRKHSSQPFGELMLCIFSLCLIFRSKQQQGLHFHNMHVLTGMSSLVHHLWMSGSLCFDNRMLNGGTYSTRIQSKKSDSGSGNQLCSPLW